MRPLSPTNPWLRRSHVTGWLVCALLLATGSAEAARSPRCRTVRGPFVSAMVMDGTCTSPVGFCTSGELMGGLRGDYELTVGQIFPTGDPTIPAVNFYTGVSLIETQLGEYIVGTDAGALDMNPAGSGAFTALITIIGGSGRLTAATGHLFVRGYSDLATGITEGFYEGEICVP